MPTPARQMTDVDAPYARVELAHGEGVARHRHRKGQLLYSVRGAMATTTTWGTWVAPANRMFWTPPGSEHHHRAYGHAEIRLLAVPIPLCTSLPAEPAVFAVGPLLREALLTLTGTSTRPPDARDRLLRVVIDELDEVPEQSLYLPEPVDDRLRAVTEQLHADPANPMTLTELGNAAGASERTLSRLFDAELGMSFHRWRTQLRIQHAFIHLTNGDLVSDTATRLGWANPTSFIEAFTAIVGQTPGRYRADMRRSSELVSSSVAVARR